MADDDPPTAPPTAPPSAPMLTHPPPPPQREVAAANDEAPPAAGPLPVVPPAVPTVKYTDVEYTHVNDVYFGTADGLQPVPVAPPVVRPVHPGRYEPPAGTTVVLPPSGPPSPTFRYRPGPTRTDISALDLGLEETDRGCSLGTTIQLLARGPQNYLLDINPSMSFFKVAYRRHTPFAVECFDDDLTLQPGRATSLEVPRRGDMLGDMFLQVSLPNLGIPGGRWVDAVGYVLLTRVRLVLNDVVLHDQERLWYDLADKVFMPHGKLDAVNAMIGRGRVLSTNAAHTVLVPFKFMCCKGHYANQHYLPLASLSNAVKITLEVTTEPLASLVHLPANASLPAHVTTLDAKLLSEQAFVDLDEKRAAMQHPARVMVESFQDIDALSYQFDDSGSYDLRRVSLDLRELNLPVKTLLFVAYDENATARKDYFRYLDCVDSATLLIASSERFAPRSGDYFSLVQTYQHATRSTPDHVHVYSFAQDAGQRQPSGALNFAVLDGPTLRVDLKNTAGKAIKIKAFAQCLNWLTVQSGSMDFVFT